MSRRSRRSFDATLAISLVLGLACLAGEARAQSEVAEPYSEASRGDRNWGHQAADAGYWSMLPVLGLGINADAFRDERPAALIVEGVAVLGTAIITPVVAAGAASVRRSSSYRINGCPLCRIAGWVSYAAMLIEAGVGLGLAIVGEIPAGLLSTTAIWGSLSLLAMATDANQSWREERRAGPLRASVVPWATLARGRGQVSGALLGIGVVR